MSAVLIAVLKPCPFCGSSGDGLLVEGDRFGQYVYCHGCETSGPFMDITDTPAIQITDEQIASLRLEAARAWNRRSA